MHDIHVQCISIYSKLTLHESKELFLFVSIIVYVNVCISSQFTVIRLDDVSLTQKVFWEGPSYSVLRVLLSRDFDEPTHYTV